MPARGFGEGMPRALPSSHLLPTFQKRCDIVYDVVMYQLYPGKGDVDLQKL